MNNCNFSILFKEIDKNDGTEYWTKEDVINIDIKDGFVDIEDKNGKIFIIPAHMIGRIDRLD